MKKVKLRLFSAAICGEILLCSTISTEAMQFQTMNYLGYYTNVTGGLSHAHMEGYTSRTANSCTFGTGETALTFKWEDYMPRSGPMLSRNKGVFIGGQKVIESLASSGKIYRITSDDGKVFYLCYGTMVGPEQFFHLIGKSQGQYYDMVTIMDLNHYVQKDLRSLDYIGAVRLHDAYIEGTEVIVSLGNNSGEEGAFYLKWDESAQWFGIEYQSY